MIHTLLYLTLFTLLENAAIAEQTNINEVTDLFDKNIDNKDVYFKEMQELNNQTAENVKSGEAVHAVEAINESESEINAINAIGEFELDNAGRKKRASNELRFYTEYQLEPDFTKAGNRMHKEDADDITKATGSFNDFIERLKEYDIEFDCKTVQGPIEKEPLYYIDLKKEEISNTIYDQFFCEEPRNEYNCRNELSVKCTTPTTTPLTPSDFTGTTLPISLDRVTGILTFGWNHNFTMHGGSGKQYDHDIRFNLNNREGVAEFTLKDVGWDDHLRIAINDHQIFLGPVSHGNQLVLVNEAFMPPRVKVDDSANRYDPEYNRWHTRSPNVNLKPYLKNGENRIKVTLIVGGRGGLWLKFKASFKKCENWQETWEERCNIK